MVACLPSTWMALDSIPAPRSGRQKREGGEEGRREGWEREGGEKEEEKEGKKWKGPQFCLACGNLTPGSH